MEQRMKILKSAAELVVFGVAIVIVSCKKDETCIDSQEKGISVITISIEQPTDECVTKTALDTVSAGVYPVNWVENDAIAVSAQSESVFVKYTLSNGAGTTSGTFTTEENAPSGAVYAYYPYSQVKSVAENVYIVDIPTQQTYLEGSFGNKALPMYASASETSCLRSMKPLMSVLKLQLKGNCKINRIVVSHISEKLSGPATVIFSESAATLSIGGTGTYDFVELLCPDVQLEEETAKPFYIVVPASSEGSAYTIRFITDKSKVLTKTLTTSEQFTAAKIKIVPELTGIDPTEVKYVSGSYCGNGIYDEITTWAPVNCGYDASNYKYGKLYQWGRHEGCGYNNGSTYTETLIQEKYPIDNIQVDNVNVIEDATKFYWGTSLTNCDWLATSNDRRWDSSDFYNSTTCCCPTKTEYDPCPAGWRLPTYPEVKRMWNKTCVWTTTGGPSQDQSGCIVGTSPNQVFFPAAGYRNTTGSFCFRGTLGYYWTSTVNNYNSRIIYFYEYGTDVSYSSGRACGHSVRCVLEREGVLYVY